MALSGLGMALWLTLHMLGNLTWLAGPELMNAYAHKLRETGLLFPVRSLLVTGVIVHVLGAIMTTRRAHQARPVAYKVSRPIRRAAALASRSMRWTGVLLLGYLVYHVARMHGVGQAEFVAEDAHRNLSAVMQRPWEAALLLGSTALVALHLGHGLASAWITLGVVSPRREALLRRVFGVWTAVVTLGFTLPLIANAFG